MTTSSSTAPARGRALAPAALIVSLLLVAAAAGLGIWANSGAIDGWYAAADKPAGTPPGWVFGPVWTALYTAMAVAAWLVWRTPAGPDRSRGLQWYAVQLAVNAAWSPVFFGAEALWAGVGVILALDVAVLSTILAFRRVHAVAWTLLVPYLAWVSYATYLSIGIAAAN
ncbi:MAG: TspO/MBR family protein [Sporichthyaceae bacterium]